MPTFVVHVEVVIYPEPWVLFEPWVVFGRICLLCELLEVLPSCRIIMHNQRVLVQGSKLLPVPLTRLSPRFSYCKRHKLGVEAWEQGYHSLNTSLTPSLPHHRKRRDLIH